jgi:hypothetical protein
MKAEIQSKLCVECSLFHTKFILISNAVEMFQRAVIFRSLWRIWGSFSLFLLKVRPCVHHPMKTYGEILLCILSLGARWSSCDKLRIPVTFRVQTDPGAHPASYRVGNGGFSPGVKRPGPEAKTRLHLVPGLRMVELHFPHVFVA